MAKSLAEAPLTTANARSKLAAGLHWRRVAADVHIGYRKGKRSGVWLVRWRVGDGYRQKPIGPADDVMKEGALSFDAAEKEGRKIVEAARREEKALAAGPLLTVRSAAEAYIKARDARDSKKAGRQVRSDAHQRLTRHLLGRDGKIDPAPLAAVAMHKLKERDLRGWLGAIDCVASGRERLASDLKAALNATFEREYERLPAELPNIIKRGLKIEAEARHELARENIILSDGEVTMLLKAIKQVDDEDAREVDLYRLHLVLAATGARMSQVIRLRVRDVQPDLRRVMMPGSFKGKGKETPPYPVALGEDVLSELQPILTGRAGDEVLLQRWVYTQRKGEGTKWFKDKREPWQSASGASREWKRIREISGIPQAVPYAFRHSSIVRAIRSQLPIRLVAALHNTSTLMIEKHYSRWIADGLDELARAAVVPLVPTAGGNVVPFAGRDRATV
jgi:integrase